MNRCGLLTKPFLMRVITMSLSMLLIACVSKVPPLRIPKLTGNCEQDVKKLMQEYVLPDQRIQHIK